MTDNPAITEADLAGIERRDKASRCHVCGTRIEMYSSDVDWCPKCRVQHMPTPRGPSELEVRLCAELRRLRREIEACGTTRDFDWNVLERLDRLETAEAEVLRLRTVTDEQVKRLGTLAQRLHAAGLPTE